MENKQACLSDKSTPNCLQMKSELLHFRVCFEGLTQQARDFWMEGEYARALDFLDACNIPIEKAHDIIRGKLKMIQDPKGKKGVDGTLAEDSWKPNLDYCQYSTYPDPDDLAKMAQDGLNYKYQYNRQNKLTFQALLDKLSEAYQASDMKEANEIWQLIDCFPVDKKEKENIPWSRKLCEDALAGIEAFDKSHNITDGGVQFTSKYILDNNPDLNEFTKNILKRDLREAPKPTKDFKTHKQGWILPSGKFYPCLTPMEHVWLAEKLGKTEKEAEEAGWVKISYTFMGIYILCFRQVTQKQLDTLFDWSVGSPERESPYKKFIMEEEIGTYNK